MGLSCLHKPTPATACSTVKHGKRNMELAARGREKRSRFQKRESSGKGNRTPPPSRHGPEARPGLCSLHLLRPRPPADQARGRVGLALSHTYTRMACPDTCQPPHDGCAHASAHRPHSQILPEHYTQLLIRKEPPQKNCSQVTHKCARTFMKSFLSEMSVTKMYLETQT